MFVATDDLIEALDVASACLSVIAKDWGTQETDGSDEAARNAGKSYRTLYERRRDTLRSLANELRDNLGLTYSPTKAREADEANEE